MHKLSEAVDCKIDEIVCHGITSSNLKYLGELVDIKKDIENIWYWKAKKMHMSSESADIHSIVSEKVGDLMKINERYKNSMSDIDKLKMHEKAKELVETASMIKDSLSGVSIDSEIDSHIKRLFK